MVFSFIVYYYAPNGYFLVSFKLVNSGHGSAAIGSSLVLD